ncbi:MAG: hypothetical protein ACK4IT_01400 [Thioalkalivibrionaceae bacterium]
MAFAPDQMAFEFPGGAARTLNLIQALPHLDTGLFRLGLIQTAAVEAAALRDGNGASLRRLPVDFDYTGAERGERVRAMNRRAAGQSIPVRCKGTAGRNY